MENVKEEKIELPVDYNKSVSDLSNETKKPWFNELFNNNHKKKCRPSKVKKSPEKADEPPAEDAAAEA